MGIASRLNDNADIPAPTHTYWPNAFGLYNMAGNVSEWVMDVYRPLIDMSTTDLNPYRGNVYTTWERDEDRFIVDKDSLGRLIREPASYKNDKRLWKRRNYSNSDNINYLDGDYDSRLSDEWGKDVNRDKWGNPVKEDVERVINDDKEKRVYNWDNPDEDKMEPIAVEQNKNTMNVYEYGTTSMISDNARVYKGGSWADRAYWMVPGSRRFLDQEQSTATIGFRCAVDRLGPPSSNLKQNRRKVVDWERKKGY